MKGKKVKASIMTIPGIAMAALAGSWLLAPRPPAARTVVLTAVMAQGIWTDEPVTAANAWRRDFRPARLELPAGETVRLRLESADVVHSFAVPDLGIDAVEVQPGKASWVTVTPMIPGRYTYYCTVVCGERHFGMQGVVEVTGDGRPAALSAGETTSVEYWREPPPSAGADAVERGRALYRKAGCVTCHGEEGRGGIRNANSMNASVPELETLARRTFLFSPSDVAAFRGVLEATGGLEMEADSAVMPLFPVVRQQYLSTRQLVRHGRRSSKLDVSGPQPPLDMPAWGVRLTGADIDAILTYLMTRETAATRTAASAAPPARPTEGAIP